MLKPKIYERKQFKMTRFIKRILKVLEFAFWS